MDVLNLIKNLSVNLNSSVDKHSDKDSNLIWVYDPSGSKKSQLLKVIYNQLKQNTKRMVCYVNAKAASEALFAYCFYDEQAAWLNLKESNALIIDGIDYLRGKTSTQEEFSKLLLTKIEKGEQVIVASGCPTAELSVLSEQLSENIKLIKL